ncbi:hypothetical protein CANINC_001284 [Pichia inconspicua]|uniref:Adenylyl cyclase-associated protein n=1 Tax=Pichia inconspicua TaxID=52247 RepID=A0A4T0X585_9ASCO|nr:hypothetical protein CANINC_001284 [[Candida] inconspicua]
MGDNNHNFSIQGYNLVTLLKRLEAATSRLEDVTIYQEEHSRGGSEASHSSNDKHVQIEGQNKAAIEAAPVVPPVEVQETIIPTSIKEFDSFIESTVKPYVELSNQIDTVLGEQALAFKEAVLKERDVLLAASNSKKVALDDGKFQELVIQPINQLIMKIIQIKDDNRSNVKFNYLNAVAEGVPVLGWIVTSTPVSYIPDFKDSAQFWTNRILKDSKGKGDEKVSSEWVKSFLNIFDELKRYVKEYHTTGITWNGEGEFETEYNKVSGDSSTNSTPLSGSAPPPPPPPPANLFDDVVVENKSTTSSSSGGVGMGAVFAELNKGEGITSGLKKVDKSEMTHKNPELRKKSVPMPPKKPKKLSSSSNVEKEVKGGRETKKEGKVELVDNKWMITNMEKEDVIDNSNGLIIIKGSMDQSVYIGQCKGVIIQIEGKVNAISMNLCERVGVIIEKAISSVEVTKCSRCEVQVTDSVPIMNIDQSESTNVYLSASSLDTELYSSCCTALNVNVPGETAEDDLKEIAISEQFVTRFGPNGKHTTEAVMFH